jgi:hypothetical protein
MATSEQDLRLGILNTLLTTPHRKLHEIYPIHQQMISQDPLFYARLAAWYNQNGEIRDHKEMFCINLALSNFEGHRDVGLAMIRELPPYEVIRVVDFIHGRKTTRKVAEKKPKSVKKKATAGGTAVATTGEQEKKPAKTVTEDFGLFKNPPRALKTEVSRYLREREADNDWFDSTALTARKALKRLYSLFHIAPGERAQKILFDREPPADSRLFQLKELAKATNPTEQAQAILQHRIPYRVATTVIKKMTPTVLLALIEAMSAQELINNLGSLKKRGAFDNSDLKQQIEKKLEQAKTSKRVSALKTGEAAKAAGVSQEVQAQLEQIADSQIKSKGRIKRPTALFIDKSGSMNIAIEMGKRIAAMLSAVCENELYVYAFDTMAYPIERAGDDLAAWEKALAGIKAGGGTASGVPLEYMIRLKQKVEQIIYVTDEDENNPPLMVPSLQKYVAHLGIEMPNVCIVRTPNSVRKMTESANRADLTVDTWDFSGDYYSLPNLIPLLTKPSKLDLLIEIMTTELPKRRSA